MWMPTRLKNGEGRAGREETNKHLSRSTGVVSTACREDDLGNWGRSGAGGGRTSNIIYRMMAGPEVGEGHTTEESRVTPVEGRTLTSDVLLKKERRGDWR